MNHPNLEWLLVRVTLPNGREFLHLCPGHENDPDLLAIFAWTQFPDATEIRFKEKLLGNPLKKGEICE